MPSVISVENLSKKYIIGHQKQERYTVLRDVLADGAKRFTRKLIHPFAEPQNDPTHEEFWALRDVSFDIQQGDRVGVIGRNGAGKSTLLKILSRITEPTSGKVSIKGRVASLLEVGTGFHPELTGRENIFLNGAILGMSRAEIKKKFDEIIAFAEVEKFLDTPVKRYSSGMYVRLAFAVAAHLEPEILVIDEVLAVGDALFQKKCMGRMEEVGKEGRTVIFVSHNMGAISELCTSAILLHQGKVVSDGETGHVIGQYLLHAKKTGNLPLNFDRDVPIYVTEIKLCDSNRSQISDVNLGHDAILEFNYTIKTPLSNVAIAVLLSRMGNPLLYSYDTDDSPSLEESVRTPGRYIVRIHLPLSRFKEGIYTAEIKIGVGQTNMSDERATISFEIINYSINTANKSFRSDRPGQLYWPLTWDTQNINQAHELESGRSVS
jgi:lipopolysaccharide transport system ATP-binding protein